MKKPFVIVGATARDILLEVQHGIGSKRATLDIDIAVLLLCLDGLKNQRWQPKY